MSPFPLVLGVDGGGTSTVAWLAGVEGAILGRGTAGPSNAKAIGTDRAREALGGAIAQARADAGLGAAPIEVACLGLAGFDRPDDRALLASWCIEDGWANRLVPANDGDLVLAAGTEDGFGIALIAGTGSIAVGRTPEGRSSRSGGWGPLIGDEGSAYAVALAGLRLVARRFDGRSQKPQQDRLTESLCRELGASTPREIVTALYGPKWDRARIAGLARWVVEASESDQAVLEFILRPAAEELVSMVDSVRSGIGWDDAEGVDPPPLAMAGGFLLGADRLQAMVRAMLGTRIGPVGMVAEPVLGAVILARRAMR
ncbi:N-acetylglucosamine kinase [Tautonia rosea]|uniref:N-acetylglucosamine kinase n=1 Tax=Tautonia rosea TaxID=2728037 RepID=UPI001473DDCF|nr:BadF/BadG/BcrA/BcrD ATPase family protein [Tautonia rosea]